MSLADYISSVNKESMNLKIVIYLILALAKSIDKLHRKRIIHRDICMDNVAVKVVPQSNKKHEKLKLQIAGLDFAFCFDKESYEVS